VNDFPEALRHKQHPLKSKILHQSTTGWHKDDRAITPFYAILGLKSVLAEADDNKALPTLRCGQRLFPF